jgi:hypothetical protein
MVEGAVHFLASDIAMGKVYALTFTVILFSFLLQNDRSQHFTNERHDIHVATFIVD